MNKSEMVQSLWERIRQPKHTLAMLSQIFEEYKATVEDFRESDPAYKEALLHTHEEFPDLSRLIGKGHDAVVKGRLLDAIGALKKKVAVIEAPRAEATASSAPETTAPADNSSNADGPAEEKPRLRNMPSLGMD